MGDIKGEEQMPAWMVRGRTVLIPKEGCTGCPEQYRPITCLNTAYKIYTGTLAEMLLEHVESCELLPPEQKALRRRRRGCLDALVIDGAVTGEAKLADKICQWHG